MVTLDNIHYLVSTHLHGARTPDRRGPLPALIHSPGGRVPLFQCQRAGRAHSDLGSKSQHQRLYSEYHIYYDECHVKAESAKVWKVRINPFRCTFYLIIPSDIIIRMFSQNDNLAREIVHLEGVVSAWCHSNLKWFPCLLYLTRLLSSPFEGSILLLCHL